MEQVDRCRDNAMKFTDAATMDHRGIILANTLAIFSSLPQRYSFFSVMEGVDITKAATLYVQLVPSSAPLSKVESGVK